MFLIFFFCYIFLVVQIVNFCLIHDIFYVFNYVENDKALFLHNKWEWNTFQLLNQVHEYNLILVSSKVEYSKNTKKVVRVEIEHFIYHNMLISSLKNRYVSLLAKKIHVTHSGDSSNKSIHQFRDKFKKKK